MESINEIIAIAEYLGLSHVVAELTQIEARFKQEDANLVLPLVGEFSSGKTTLINALTDNKKLETATKPTTSTIYEVHFGCDSCRATILDDKGQLTEVDDIANLKNEILADAKVVTVFDTSSKVPASTILVDTPGLSSPDVKHKQTLVNFLPKADGLLLVTDINQQVTRSLTDFIETMKLSRRPIFLILTKSDTKSVHDIELAKTYISENCKIPVKRMAVVSSYKGDLEELYSLLADIQKDKKEIIKQVDAFRVKSIVNTLLTRIEELMSASVSDKELDEAIRRGQYELDKIKRNIDRLVDSMADDIESHERNVCRMFEDTIFSKLNGLVTGRSNNFDGEAVSIINNTASLLMNDYKSGIQDLLHEKAREQKGTENELPLSSLEELDLSEIRMSGLSYNLDLNSMGHEYDGLIKTGLIVAAAAGTVAVVASTGGAATGVLGAASTVDNLIDVADTVSDVESIISNQRAVGRMEKAVDFITNTTKQYSSFDESNREMGQQMGRDKGMIDSMVGFVTDNMMSKPQRVRAIRNYIDTLLTPEFKNGLKDITRKVVLGIKNNLQNEASQMIEQKAAALNQLKVELKEKKDLFNKRMEQLREYKMKLLTM